MRQAKSQEEVRAPVGRVILRVGEKEEAGRQQGERQDQRQQRGAVQPTASPEHPLPSVARRHHGKQSDAGHHRHLRRQQEGEAPRHAVDADFSRHPRVDRKPQQAVRRHRGVDAEGEPEGHEGAEAREQSRRPPRRRRVSLAQDRAVRATPRQATAASRRAPRSAWRETPRRGSVARAPRVRAYAPARPPCTRAATAAAPAARRRMRAARGTVCRSADRAARRWRARRRPPEAAGWRTCAARGRR